MPWRETYMDIFNIQAGVGLYMERKLHPCVLFPKEVGINQNHSIQENVY